MRKGRTGTEEEDGKVVDLVGVWKGEEEVGFVAISLAQLSKG